MEKYVVKIRCNILIALLLVAICGISVSFYSNHKRLKQETKRLKLQVSRYYHGLSATEASFVREVMGEDFSRGFSLHKVLLKDQYFMFCDLITSDTVPMIANEVGDNSYDFSSIDFKEGDVVIDIGGNVGMISIFLAKKYPFLRIYAFEPVKENFENFKRNIKLNKIPDGVITVENLAVTKDARIVNLNIDMTNTGGSSLCEEKDVGGFQSCDVQSVTLEDIFEKFALKSCKLLKIDCEGSEYEILYNTDKDILKKCEHMRGEFHENNYIRKQGYSIAALEKYCEEIIGEVLVGHHGEP
ncbi:MAG: FkbM family methyltransferase [Puniceicoccales bacterium]|jgi:FkbM family methyltransferase|nr:FkbM family methyltransferase [Puniceicoccales bacterium]